MTDQENLRFNIVQLAMGNKAALAEIPSIAEILADAKKIHKWVTQEEKKA